MNSRQPVAVDAPGDGSAKAMRNGTACEGRGFHGPYLTDPANSSNEDVAICKACGARIAVVEHEPAYLIAWFHGLAP